MRYFECAHPEIRHSKFFLRAFISVSAGFICRAAHDKTAAFDWYHSKFYTGIWYQLFIGSECVVDLR